MVFFIFFGEDGFVDLFYILGVVEQLSKFIIFYKVIVDKSIVLVGIVEEVYKIFFKNLM